MWGFGNLNTFIVFFVSFVIVLYKEFNTPVTFSELKVCYYHISVTEVGMWNGGRSVTSQPPDAQSAGVMLFANCVASLLWSEIGNKTNSDNVELTLLLPKGDLGESWGGTLYQGVWW